MDTKQRELHKRILDRIASDPRFREELLDDPRGAMERAGFSWESGSGDEVSGYGLFSTTALTCPQPADPAGNLYGGIVGGTGTTAITCTDPPVKKEPPPNPDPYLDPPPPTDS
jgi:hypothetical protein